MNIPVNKNTVFNSEIGEFENLPEIVLFTIDKNILTDETPAIVNWEVVNATMIRLNKEPVEPKGSKTIYTNDLLSISIYASNDAGEAPMQTLMLDINRQPPVIIFFKIDVPFAIEGSPITLSWNIEGARLIEIDNGIGDVSNLNSKVITLGKNGVFNLTAKNYFGVTVEKHTAISIFPIPIVEGVFIPKPQFNFRVLSLIQTAFNFNLISFNQPSFNVGAISFNQPKFNLVTNIPENLEKNRPTFTKIDKLSIKILFEQKTPNSILFFKKYFEQLTKIIHRNVKLIWKRRI